jgi:hypothetical protein
MTSGWSVEVSIRRDPALDRTSLQAVAREVARLLAVPDRPLLTAQEVATRFNVDRGWVYAHADELGVVRIGQGPRPRLRFDAAVVAQQLLGGRGREVAPRAYTPQTAGAPLLPIRRPASKRTRRPRDAETSDG